MQMNIFSVNISVLKRKPVPSSVSQKESLEHEHVFISNTGFNNVM